jgi:membrane protein YdbS with pleckstrin-like domain
MPYPKHLINEGEDVALDLNPHWWYFSKHILTGIPLLLALIGILALDGDVRTVLGYVWAVVAVVWAIWLLLKFLAWRFTHFVVTSDRLIYRHGVLAKRGVEIPLERINNINFEQRIWERIIGAGDLQIDSAGINVVVRHSTSENTDSFPPSDAAYILRNGHQPGRNTNSYIFAHAVNHLFKPLWNVQVGAEVLIRMSDDSVRRYVVTEVRPNVACPDQDATENNPEDFGVTPPLALQIHDNCSEAGFWTAPTEYERITLQTSHGYNRNWGELVVVADPAD